MGRRVELLMAPQSLPRGRPLSGQRWASGEAVAEGTVP